MEDLDRTWRDLYRYLRSHPRVLLRGQAYMVARRALEPGPITTFMVASDGTCWRYDKAAFLADLRLLLLQHHPVGFVARWDRNFSALRSGEEESCSD